MKRTLIALALAVPFAASAAPLTSFNDNADISGYVALTTQANASQAGVKPSFDDTTEIRSDAVQGSGISVQANTDFHYPAY